MTGMTIGVAMPADAPGQAASTLHRSWERAWSGVGAHGSNHTLRDQLTACYAEPHRHYHTLQHLAECMVGLEGALHLEEHRGEVEMALWFHDAIYDVRRADNEERSAEWAKDQLLSAGALPLVADRVYKLVMVTRHAALPQAPDECLLVDVDLSILGATPARFAQYEAQVRQEYAWVPNEVFRSKRREILQAFLARPTIYNTPHFHDALELRARENLQSSIDGLAT